MMLGLKASTVVFADGRIFWKIVIVSQKILEKIQRETKRLFILLKIKME